MSITWAIIIAVIVYLLVWFFIKKRANVVEDPNAKKKLVHIADNPVMYFVFYFIALVILNMIFGVY